MKTTRRNSAITLLEVTLAIALIALMTAATITSRKLASNQMAAKQSRLAQRVAVRSVLPAEIPLQFSGKIFQVRFIYTNNFGREVFIGETAEGKQSVSFICEALSKLGRLESGKYYSPTRNGITEVIGPTTNSPTAQE